MSSSTTPHRKPSAGAREPRDVRDASSRASVSHSVSSLSDSGESDEDASWVAWFCSLRGHDLFTEVDDAFIEDEFNLHGLLSLVPNYEYAKDLILDVEVEYKLNPEQAAQVERSAELLYGLIHARYIITPKGLDQMLEKYHAFDFGRCPRVFCEGQSALPIGQSDLPRQSLAKLYCPRCQDIFYPPVAKHSRLDGAYFGTSFAHLFLQTYPELLPEPPKASFVPRLFGFKLHPSARAVLAEEAEEKRKRHRAQARGTRGSRSTSPASHLARSSEVNNAERYSDRSSERPPYTPSLTPTVSRPPSARGASADSGKRQ